MDISIILAEILGGYLVIMSLALLIRPKYFEGISHDYRRNRAVGYLSTVITLIAGLVLIVIHKVWSMDWRLVITLFSWLILIKGIIRLYLPDIDERLISFYESKLMVNVFGIFTLIIGIYLLDKALIGF